MEDLNLIERRIQAKQKKWMIRKINKEHFKKHSDFDKFEDKEHNRYAGEMDRLYRREFYLDENGKNKYRWVRTAFLQCRICGVVVHENDC